MLRLDKVIKSWKESAALNDHINLYGFWNETAFLTKRGDVGMILSLSGVGYERRYLRRSKPLAQASMFTSTSSNRIARTYHSRHTTTLLSKRRSISGGSSLKP